MNNAVEVIAKVHRIRRLSVIVSFQKLRFLVSLGQRPHVTGWDLGLASETVTWLAARAAGMAVG